ncbi:TIGR02186 family protein [Roseibacterium sp. SDUM158016]|uniref:TIGR02186 family protein n=1 Tax=Roseicyclus sediminis TaxID=2980997 RepID=UPI0021D17A6B|nr:TIGR02186 family protein [Roseibacterium sp. SDUM158016]MCU4655231.1 TIGR02186 family protein [Roseibacterium sp. SDUM158016]
MIRLIVILAACLGLTVKAGAETVVAGLSHDAISITTNFEGSEILIFGAVRRDRPPPEGSDLEVIVTVEAPARPVTVRRKARRFGIWMNTDAIEVDAAPTFYAVAATGRLDEVMTATEDLRHRVSIPMAIRAVGTGVGDQDTFIEALIRIRTDEGLYQLNEGAVTLRDQTLFDTAVRLPANLVEGDYRTRIFLTRNGEVVDAFSQDIAVRKVGLERWIFNLAHDRPLAYGILSLAIAIAAGWGASAMFRYIRS